MTDIEAIPFYEIARALSATTHSRNMAGALLALFPNIVHGGVISKHCASPEFVRAAVYAQSPEVDWPLLCKGMLPETRVVRYAEAALTADYETHKNDARYQVGLIALGSPLLGGHLKRILTRIPHITDALPTTHGRLASRNALFGNPLVHGAEAEVKTTSPALWAYLHNAATFGNLQNPHVAHSLSLILRRKASWKGIDGGERKLLDSARNGLYSRNDVPEELIVAMRNHNSTVLSCQRLVKTACHQQLVREGRSDAVILFPNDGLDGRCVASPLATPEQLMAQYRGAFADGSVQRSLLLAKNAPEEFYRNAVATGSSFLRSIEFLQDSPWAPTHLAKQDDGALLNELFAGRSGEGTQVVLSLPVIPFDRIDPKGLQSFFKEVGRDGGASIVGAIGSKKFADALGQVGDNPKNDLALLFSPYTSGRQVENFAKLYPKLAGLAACHPNGADISIASVPSEQREVVEQLRTTPVLAGNAGGGRQKTPKDERLII